MSAAPDPGPIVVVRADSRTLPLPDGSVDLIVTSPPYHLARSYETARGAALEGQLGAGEGTAGYLAELWAVTAEAFRVLRPSGSLWLNLGDRYASRQEPGGPPVRSLAGLPWRYAFGCTDRLGLVLRAEVVWEKATGLPERVTDRVRREHETWLHLTRPGPYWAAMDGLREPHRMKPQRRLTPRRQDLTVRPGQPPRSWSGLVRDTPGVDGHPLGRLPGSVRRVPAAGPLRPPADLCLPEHPARFPVDWPLWFVEGWCPPGGVVLDPMGGSGTVALAASVLGRVGVSSDLSGGYSRLAVWRTADPAERSGAAAKAPAGAVLAGSVPDLGQGVLFG